MNTTYGERLERALQLAGKDRLYLAGQIDISVQAIGQVIAGKTKALTAENTARAARVLNVDFYWLATGEGDPSPAANGWPFKSFSKERYEAAPTAIRGVIEGRALGFLEEWERNAERAGDKAI